MIVAFLTPGPWQAIIVLLMVAVICGVRLLPVMNARAFQVTLRDLPRQYSINALLQLCTIVAVVCGAFVVFGPVAAGIFAVTVLVVVLSRL